MCLCDVVLERGIVSSLSLSLQFRSKYCQYCTYLFIHNCVKYQFSCVVVNPGQQDFFKGFLKSHPERALASQLSHRSIYIEGVRQTISQLRNNPIQLGKTLHTTTIWRIQPTSYSSLQAATHVCVYVLSVRMPQLPRCPYYVNNICNVLAADCYRFQPLQPRQTSQLVRCISKSRSEVLVLSNFIFNA